MTTVSPLEVPGPATNKRTTVVVDTDVHPVPRSLDELAEYYEEPWRSFEFTGPQRPIDNNTRIAQTPNGGNRVDAKPPGGGPPGSDPAFAARQLRAMADVAHAILIPLASVRPRENPEREAAACRATNKWLADTWLGKDNQDDMFRGSLRIAIDEPRLAVAEIEHWAGHPGFVQVAMGPSTKVPLGDPVFDDVHRAAARHGLPLAVHPLTAPGARLLTAVGYPSYFSEYHSEMALGSAAHLISLIFNGTFERYPDLRCVIIESGIAWATPLLWKMDRHWREFREAYPWLRRKPSEVVAERVRFTTQPLENPTPARDLVDIIEFTGIDQLFMFSSDYPHHDTDEPDWVLGHLPPRLRERIMGANALDFYGLNPGRSDQQ
ncbi:amidohydrolase family protein [Amycolatopsis echigonensis]